jgi:3-polyprenyl-4-hydroxybenzoate decarboxylase
MENYWQLGSQARGFQTTYMRWERQMTPVRSAIGVAAILLLSAATPASTEQDEPAAGGELFERMQSEFADAYNRKDVPAMAAFFSENGVRITPAGVFRGRDAIRPADQGSNRRV